MDLKQIWVKISNNGVTQKHGFEEKKRIKIINQFCFLGFIFTFPTSIIFIIINAHRQSLLELTLALIWIIVFFITKRNYKVGAAFLFITMAAVLLFISLIYGNVGAEYFYFSLFILTFYIFRNRYILCSFLIYLVTLFSIAKLFQHTVVLTGKDAVIAPYIFTINIILSFLAGAYFLALFILEHEGYMHEVEEKNLLLQNALIDANNSKEEIKILLGELNHRTKNNLQLVSSLINNQASKLTDDCAKKALLDGKNRIVSIALIHKKLYQNENFSSVSFREYVDDLINHLTDVFDDNSNTVQIYKDIEDFDIKIDNAVTLGLIINELLTNSFKHGLTGNLPKFIRVQIHCISENELDILVSDSGTGIEEMFKEKETETFGAGLILSLVKQLDGNIINDIDTGNSVHIRLRHNL